MLILPSERVVHVDAFVARHSRMFLLFFFKQKTAYEMRISDWSSDVCSSDLAPLHARGVPDPRDRGRREDHRCRDGDGIPPPVDGEAGRSEERRVGKSVSVRVDLGGRRIITKKKTTEHPSITQITSNHIYKQHYTLERHCHVFSDKL